MLHVANIILESRWGGPQHRILQVAERLKDYNIKTTVIIPVKPSNFFYNKLIEKEISVVRFPLYRLSKTKKILIKDFLFWFPQLYRLVNFLKKSDVRIVHTNGAWQIKGIIAGKLAGKKVICHLNDTWIPLPIKMIFNFVSPLCDGFIFASEKSKTFYSNNFNFSKRHLIIPAPVDTSVFDPEKNEEMPDISNHKGIKISMTANINPTKGIEYFVNMAHLLNKNYSNLKFYIAGNFNKETQGEYLYSIEKMFKKKMNNIFLMGRIDNVPSFLKSTDIHVCASINESSPMSVWEAMAMEKPVVSTDVGDVAKYISNGKNGFIVPIKDCKALADKVSFLIKNEGKMKEFGKRSRAIAKKHLDISIIAKKHAEFYSMILKN